MSKNISLFLYGEADQSTLVQQAALLAKKYEAKLQGVYVTPDILDYSSLQGPCPPSIAADLRETHQALAEKAKLTFDQITDEHSLDSQWFVMKEYSAKNEIALYSDYNIVPQPQYGQSPFIDSLNFVDTLILTTGRPTFVLPSSFQGGFGDKVAIGWKESKEAVSAITKTTSFLRLAKEVSVFSVVKNDKNKADGEKVLQLLEKEAIQAEFNTLVKGKGMNDSSLLLNLSNQDFDCILIGAYGHSRLQEMILGGITRDLIRESKIPVLLAH